MRAAAFLILPLATALASPAVSAQTLTEAKSSPPAHPAPAKLSAEDRGDILMARKEYREAIDAYQEDSPISAVVMNKIGIAYHQLNELKTARKWYEKSVKAKPDYAEAINNIGTVFYAQKNYRRAITQYQKALSISPRSASIHSNLGTAHFARKKYEDAVKEYEIALSLDPEVFEHRNSTGSLLLERNVEERAKFHYYLSKMYAKTGNIELSLQYMRKSLEEGFKDRKKYQEEPEFADVRKNPEFEVIMKLEPRVL